MPLLLAVTSSTLGCFVDHRDSKVYYDTCGEECRLPDHPLAAGGATTPIGVKDLDFATVRSTDPTVVDFRIDSPTRIVATTGHPGSARLQLLDRRNHLLGEWDLTVSATAELRILKGWGDDAPRILAGTAQQLHVSTMAADGSSLKGDGAVQFTLGGTLTPAPFSPNGDSIGFVGTPGTGTISASCPDANVTQSVTVVAPEAITHLVMFTAGGADKDGLVSVFVGPESADGPVYGGDCAWDAIDPAVQLGTYVPAKLENTTLGAYVFKIEKPGSYPVTCHIGGATATINVGR